ncbi:transglycosylase SLT domain-containing protein [Desulfolithobacter sp.]
MRTVLLQRLLTAVLCLFCALTSVLVSTAAAAKPFPVYPAIRDNVRFWEKVYSKYSTRQGILHDKEDLTRIYDIIELVDWQTPGAARINRQMIKMARKRYKAILADLAAGKKPLTREAKRVRALFPDRTTHKAFRRARNNIRLQIGQKDRFLEGVIRSGTYMGMIRKILRAHGLPLEIAYLPHVESSFNPKAHSKVGAAGLWQFTRATGKRYLTINNVLDERYDPVLSTVAAARFLKKIYADLEDWPLALTAYNYGPAGMARAKKLYGSYEKIFFNHKAGRFKFASRNFYSEFLAAMRVARKLEKDPRIIVDRPEATITKRLPGYALASELQRYFNISRQDFKRLNPALRRPVLEGRKYVPAKYLLRLPATKRIRKLAASMPDRLFHSRQIRDTTYRVRRGDTASGIAKRYRISLRELIRTNNLDKNATIRVGQILKIPDPHQRRKKIVILKDRAKRKP